MNKIKVLLSIIERGKGSEYIESLNAQNVKFNLQTVGHGTAPSEMKDIFGLVNSEKDVVFSFAPEATLAAFAAQYAETLHKVGSLSVVICDRDAVIACSGVPKKEFLEKQLSDELEALTDKRALYQYKSDGDKLPVLSGGSEHYVRCSMPIISEGDIIGCVASICEMSSVPTISADVEAKLILTAAGFLGKQLES